MIEDEAKTKWCPFVRMNFASQSKSDVIFYNNRGEAGDGLKDETVNLCCIASECMAWRWTDPKNVAQKDRRGCCGLAGRP